MKTIKISELPLYTSLKGLYTIGTDIDNRSVKVSLAFVEQQTSAAVKNAEAATTKATNAAADADAARQKAETATKEATTATANATAATTKANDAATKADTATKNADAATSKANTAAENAKKTAEDAAIKAEEKATTAANNANNAAADARKAEASANEATEKANAATQDAKDATADLRFTLATLVPTGLNVKPVPRITLGNKMPVFIDVTLTPEQVMKNIIFISDNRSVSVSQDGRLTVIGEGRSQVQIIPTLNTALAKTIEVVVGEPTLRLVNSRTRLRLTSSGDLRLN